VLSISDNLKTRYSINLDHGSCRPTKRCKQCCYGKYVSAKEAEACGIRTNAGPVTWPAAQNAYQRNRLWLEQASESELRAAAKKIAKRLRRAGLDNIRVCGMGDATPGLVRLCHHLVGEGIHPWGFSKKPEMIARMPKSSSMIGSVDDSMPESRVLRLMTATKKLLGTPTLAYMTMLAGKAGAQEVKSLWFLRHLVVVFGYHASGFKTVVSHPLACAATNGEDLHCQDCKRCITPRSC